MPSSAGAGDLARRPGVRHSGKAMSRRRQSAAIEAGAEAPDLVVGVPIHCLYQHKCRAAGRPPAAPGPTRPIVPYRAAPVSEKPWPQVAQRDRARHVLAWPGDQVAARLSRASAKPLEAQVVRFGAPLVNTNLLAPPPKDPSCWRARSTAAAAASPWPVAGGWPVGEGLTQ